MSSWHVAGAAACLLTLGCANHQPRASRFDSLPLSSLSSAELTARINADAASVTSMKGKLELGMCVPPQTELQRCRGAIASRSLWGGGSAPGLYLTGYRQLIPTLFTLVSDGHEFWLHVPYDNTVYSGALAGAHPVRHGREIELDAHDLFQALFVEPVEARDSVQVTEEGSSFVVSISRDGTLHRRMWVDRRGVAVTRETIYGPLGTSRLQIDRDSWADVGGRWYPHRIVLTETASGTRVVLEFSKVTLQPEKLDEGLFKPKIPPGAVVRRVETREAGR